jgi:hypothetical protein
VLSILEYTRRLVIEVLWKSLGVRGETRRPTVVISSANTDEAMWVEKVLPELKDVLGLDMEVEFWYRKSPQEHADKIPPIPGKIVAISVESCEKCVTMGSSIGIAGNDRSGTLSMRIKL